RKQFGKTTAVDGISFDIQEGRCITLLGSNGAGKTTTLSMLSGLLAPNGGEILFQGSKGKDIRQYIGYLPQYPAFYNWMSGKEFLQFIGQLVHLNKSEVRKRTEELLKLVGLSHAENRRIGGYSGGMKQRLGIAQAMMNQPKLLILDEPVSALDPLGRREVLDMMKEIKQKTTILFSMHVLHDAQEITDDIVIMHSGRIAVAGELKTIMKQYEPPIIRIESETSLQQWCESLRNHEYVVDVISQDESVLVKDLEKSKILILKEIIEKKIPIRKFEVAQTTLEDLFMKVVSS
ncbi:MAG: ABC transporter ATP-binding protein, partial [Bacilli bacterium]